MRALELGRGKYRFTGRRILIFMTIRFIVHLLTQIALLKGFLEYFTGFLLIFARFIIIISVHWLSSSSNSCVQDVPKGTNNPTIFAQISTARSVLTGSMSSYYCQTDR